MLDLCDKRLGTTVRVSPLDDDVHVADNLLSTDPNKRKLGYKPALYIGGILAVDVIFSFPVSVSTVQFSTTCSKPTKAQMWLSRNIPVETTTTKPYHMTLISTIPLSPPTSTVILSNSSPGQLSTRDLSRDTRDLSRDTRDLSRDTPILRIPDSYETRSCQCLRIVVETMGADRWLGEVKVLGDVGLVGRNYLKRENVTRKDILKLVEEVKSKIKKEKTEKEQQNVSSLPQSSAKERKTETRTETKSTVSKHSIDSDVPEEFLDAITREIMLCPVILPSGNVVDVSTIDKHTEAERKWGRESSDPFTGVPFRGEHVAVHHTSLKERIDRWREWRGGLGRCVGVSSGGGNTSEQILNKRAKRVRPTEDKASSTRAKRLKKLQPNHEQSDDLTITKTVNGSVQNTHNSNTTPRQTKMGNATGSNSDVPDSKRSTVEPNKEPNKELSRMERTLQLLASHEERLELF